MNSIPKFVLFAFLIFPSIIANAQKNGRIFGTYWNGNSEVFAQIDLNHFQYKDLSTLPDVHSIIQGASTFDFRGNRYFNITNLGITIISGQTGNIIDTISNKIQMNGIEYSPNTNQLIGTCWDSDNLIFTQIDILTKTFHKIDTLKGVNKLYAGESTYDSKNERYFIITNLGITVIDAKKGLIIDAIPNTYKLKSIEYCENSGKIVGTCWLENKKKFVVLDLENGKFEFLNNLNNINFLIQGSTTFSPDNGQYFTITDLGITLISISNGSIKKNIDNTIRLKGIEFSPTYIYDFQTNNDPIIHPNPFKESTFIFLENSISDGIIYIFNLQGKMVKILNNVNGNQIKVDRGELSEGVYFFRISEKNQVITTKKIMLTN